MALAPGPATSQQVTADAVVGTADVPTTVWSITIQSGTTVTITIRNGDEVTDAILWGPTVAYTPAATVAPFHATFPNGLYCPAGAYADVAGTSPVVDVTYTQAPYVGPYVGA